MSNPFGHRPPEDVPTPKAPEPSSVPLGGFGQPVDPKGLPTPPVDAPLPVTMPMGVPLPMNPPTTKRSLVRNVALGFSVGAEAPQLPEGFSSRGSNFVSFRGGLSPRPGLMSLSSVSQFFTNPAGWVGELSDSTGARYPVLLSSRTCAYYSNGSWSLLSYSDGSAVGNGPTLSYPTYIDASTYFNSQSNEFELVWTDGVQGPYTFRASNAPLFSTITRTSATMLGRFVVPFDSRLVWANGGVLNSTYCQRVEWSAPGNAQNYAAPDGGSQDLLDARGVITRIMPSDDRLIVFFNQEIWQGFKVAFPFNFDFAPLDRTVGTNASWSVAQTPRGIMFMGDDLNVYLIPKQGGPPVAIGTDVQRFLRDNLSNSQQSIVNGGFVNELNSYMLTFQTPQGGEQGLLVNLDSTPRWTPIGFDRPSGWHIRRLGQTSQQTITANFPASQQAGQRRTLVADSGNTGKGNSNVMDFTSLATDDLGSVIDCRYMTVVANPDPTTRLYVNQVRIDYRSPSNSSVSIRLTPDFGTTYPVDTGVALPAAAISAQTIVNASMTAIYPGIEFRHASGHTFSIQGASLVMESAGNA